MIRPRPGGDNLRPVKTPSSSAALTVLTFAAAVPDRSSARTRICRGRRHDHGIVSTDGNAAVPCRKVTAVNTATGTRYDVTTGINGGYTLKVPEGTYRLEIELMPGETIAKQPDETRINRSDLDPGVIS